MRGAKQPSAHWHASRRSPTRCMSSLPKHCRNRRCPQPESRPKNSYDVDPRQLELFADDDPDPPEPPDPSDPDPPAPEPPPRSDEQPHTEPVPPDDPAPTETRQRSMAEAVDLIYAQGQQRTLESVASVLGQCDDHRVWDEDDIDQLRNALEGAADWYGEHNSTAQTFFSFETSPILFGTAAGVILYEDHGLKVLTWSEAMERIAPEVAESSMSLPDAGTKVRGSSARSYRPNASSRR